MAPNGAVSHKFERNYRPEQNYDVIMSVPNFSYGLRNLAQVGWTTELLALIKLNGSLFLF